MKRWLIVVLLGSRLAAAAQENYSLQETSLLPVRFYVGDHVELRIHIKAKPGVGLRPPDPLPRGSWLQIDRILCSRIREDIWLARIFFTTYKPGSHLLPEIDLGEIRLTDLKVETRSILFDRRAGRIAESRSGRYAGDYLEQNADRPALKTGEWHTEEPGGPREQLFLPGTWARLGGVLVVVITAPLMFFFGLRISTRLIRYYRLRMRKSLARTRANRALRLLKRRLREYDARGFFIRITDIMREYLERRLRFPAYAATTLELNRGLAAHFARTAPSPTFEKLSVDIVALFRQGDRVKFGGDDLVEGERELVIDKVSGFVVSLEEAAQNVDV